MLAYLARGMIGRDVDLVEIGCDEIVFCRIEDADDADDADPLKVSVRYFARRGTEMGEMHTTSFHDKDGRRVDRVFFRGETMKPELLHQVWRVDPRSV